MKKLVLLVVALAAVVALCYGAAVAIDNHYQSSQKQKQAQAVPMVTKKSADQAVQDIKTATAGEFQSEVVQYNDQVAQCQKGSVAYAKLTPAQKAQTPAPVCGTPQQ